MDRVLVDGRQIVSDVRAVVAARVKVVLELLGMPTLPDSVRATRAHGTVCFTGMLSNRWAMNEFDPVNYIPRAHANRSRVSDKLVAVVNPADAAITTKR